VKLLKDGEDQKRKTYMALCIAPSRPFVSIKDLEKLSEMKNLELQQKTPIRMLHRRPNSIRSQTVYEMNAEPISKDQLNHFEDLDTNLDSNETQQVFRLRLTIQAGTYVKEFIHRVFRRTSPNLREILGILDLEGNDHLIEFHLTFSVDKNFLLN
jgi:tRNA pseudouridine synthase 10